MGQIKVKLSIFNSITIIFVLETMESLPVQIHINETLYIKNPESSELGRKIVSKSIEMIDSLGFETFTFRKLGVAIKSNESSIYRYFDSKHMLLIYLTNWYWSWIEYKLVFATANVASSLDKLTNAIQLLTEEVKQDTSIGYINEIVLNRIIISEASKTYHTKDIAEENKRGCYQTYKRVVQRVSDMVLEVNPVFQFPHMLISTVIEGAHHQRYFSQYLPSLTDVKEGQNTITNFYIHLVRHTISENMPSKEVI